MKRLYVLLVVFLVGCGSNDEIKSVKNGYLEFDKSITISDAFDNYKMFKKTKWKLFKTSNNRKVVQFSGSIDKKYLDKIYEANIEQAEYSKVVFNNASEKYKKELDDGVRKIKDCYNRIDVVNLDVQFSINHDDTFKLLYTGFTIVGKSGNEKEMDIDVYDTITTLYKNTDLDLWDVVPNKIANPNVLESFWYTL